jgi:hypothetical protein
MNIIMSGINIIVMKDIKSLLRMFFFFREIMTTRPPFQDVVFKISFFVFLFFPLKVQDTQEKQGKK